MFQKKVKLMFPNDIRIIEMVNLATKYHAGQVRKFFDPPVPYIVHPLQVATNVDCLNISDQELKIKMICAAIGHDLLEDTSVTGQEIIDVAGEDVLILIKELTNPSKSMKAPRYIRKQVDRDHLKTVSNEAKIIKLIDRTVNLEDFEGCDDVNFVKLYIKESRDLLEVIKNADEQLAFILNKTIENLENKLDINRNDL